VLREAAADQTLRDHLIATAARLLAERGSAGLTVREIAREARVADGVLYNHFRNKEELLAHALSTHVNAVMSADRQLPDPGQGTVEANLRAYIEYGLRVLTKVLPAFAGFLAQQNVIARAWELLGYADNAADSAPSLPALVGAYLRGEQELGRIAAGASVPAATTLIVGACHELTLPRILVAPAAPPPEVPAAFIAELAAVAMAGLTER
jgi:AcrR family transcriptional regulator